MKRMTEPSPRFNHCPIFFYLFASALALFHKHQRLPIVNQKCFYTFFRSEAVFDLLFVSDEIEH